MTSRTRAVIISALFLMSAVGCSSGSKSSQETTTTEATASTTPTTPTTAAPAKGHMTAQEVATRLVPLGCTATPSTSQTVDVGIKPVTALECKINGESVSIDEYLNAEQVSHNNGLVQGVGCTFGKGFGITEFHYVSDANWTVSADTAPTAEAIRDAIGGKAKVITIKCPG